MITHPPVPAGPYPILGRGHSGGRLLCEAFIQNGIAMGQVNPARKDTPFFSVAHEDMYELVRNAYRYPAADAREQQRLQALLRARVNGFLAAEIPPQPGTFGWKLGITLFILPMVLDTFPAAKVIHLIRDGRDVMLSRLNARIANLADPLNRLTVFGDEHTDQFAGRPLTAETIHQFRNALEMQHWVTAVRYGLRGRAYSGRYLEVYYEAFCRQPLAEFQKICDFLELEFLPQTRHWLTHTVRSDRIGKWRGLSAREMAKPLEIGGALLTELGYLS